jgi:hypothetical protein
MKNWPAYHHSKFLFHAHDANRVPYTGIFVEKGLSPAVAAAYPSCRVSPSFSSKPGGYRHRFVSTTSSRPGPSWMML